MPNSFQALIPEGTNTGAAAEPEIQYQYKRDFKLLVTGASGNGFDLSSLHCKFSTKRSHNETPNSAEIRVYNLSEKTQSEIVNNFGPILVPAGNGTINVLGTPGYVTIQAGYVGNTGVIFQGNIKQIICGRESATDTFTDFICGDGDFAYNYAIVNKSIAVGSSENMEQAAFNAITQSMSDLGIGIGLSGGPTLKPSGLSRGKTMFGASRDKLRTLMKQNNQVWSIQNSQFQFSPTTGYAAGETVILTSKTGIIGTPQQTTDGVNIVCLINPRISPGQTVKIDNKSVAQLKLDLGNTKDPANIPAPLRLDGVYYVAVIENSGDNRGLDWYSKLICYGVSPSSNPINSVNVSYGI